MHHIICEGLTRGGRLTVQHKISGLVMGNGFYSVEQIFTECVLCVELFAML